MFFYFLLGLRIACQLLTWCPRVLTFPIVLTTKKTLIVIKTIVKTRDPRDEIENEVANSVTLNSQTFFLQASCNVTSFPPVLDLMHKCYVISFADVFHFFIWQSTSFVAYFHISTSQKLRGNEIGILFLTLRTLENNEELKLSFTNKTHVYSFLVIYDVLRLYVRLYVVTEKS